MEDPIQPRHVDLDSDSTTRPRGLVRRSSKLQTHVEVLRCRLGKPATIQETNPTFAPSKRWTPIYYAVYHQREAALIHFLRTGGSPDDVDEIGQPPLCIAVANGYHSIVEILLSAGADVNAAIKEGGETALHIAIKNSRVEIHDMLLRHDPDLEARTTKTGETPLHYAASRSGSLATIVSLLKLGAKYDTLDANGQTPAEAALKASNIQGAVAIINAARGKCNKFIKEKEMLLKHVEKKQNKFSIGNELIADIFSATCDPESTVLVEAIKRNDAGLVEMFLAKGADPDRETAMGVRPIFAALECASAPVVQTLVKYNADVTLRDTKGLTVLQAAFEGPLAQDKETLNAICKVLLSQGADATVTYPDGKTLLHRVVAPEFAHARVAQIFLGSGVRIDAQDIDGNTALHLATHSQACMEMLLKSGANARVANSKGKTPLLYAATNAKKEKEPGLDSLIKASELRQIDMSGQSALHLAAARGLEKTIRLLLKARAETAIVDANQHTPLLLAVLNHQWHIVPMLAIAPSVNSSDAEGLTALHHIARSTPVAPSTWIDISAAVFPFCERGVSRSMRDRSGATPLIVAVKTLPEDGLPVVEALLAQTVDKRSSWSCVSHEDHGGRDALYYAATLGKPAFFEALLNHGASFEFKDWVLGRGPLAEALGNDRSISKHIAQCEWSRRAGALRRRSRTPDSENAPPTFSTMFPVTLLGNMLATGLDPNALPKTALGSSMMWAILRQIPLRTALSTEYLFDTINLVLQHGGDPNFITTRSIRRSPSPQASTPEPPLATHPLTFLIEEHPTVDVKLVTLFLTRGASLSVASTSYSGSYPLHSAVKVNRMDLVDEILLQRADTNCLDQDGRTPLFFAAEKGSWGIADALLRRGAKVDMRDSEGNSVLHAAAISGSKRVVAMFLRAGSKASTGNVKGKTPLACVPEGLDAKERDLIVRMLKDAEFKETQNVQRAANEVKIKQLREEDVTAKRHKERKETERKQQEARQQGQQHPKEPEQAIQPSATLPAKPPTKKRSSFFRASLLLSARPTVAAATTLVLPPTQPEPRLHTTSSPSQSTAPNISETSKSPPKIANSTTAVDLRKRLPSPRVDSGFDQQRPDLDKPLPVPDRSQPSLGEDSDSKKRNSNAVELADWLALSEMMESM
jgi:ankyrin repeat protein